MREETAIDAREAARVRATHDEGAKRLFSNKEIVAPILTMVVPEFKGLSTAEAMRCIEGEISSDVPVSDIGLRIHGEDTESSSTTEKLIRFDKAFKALNPLHREGRDRLSVHLHIDLEMQDRYHPSNPSYPLTKRGIYYGARGLSRQLGTVTERTDYAALEKCYSIWISDNVTARPLQNTVTKYSITREDVVGRCREPEAYHDLITVIVIRLGPDLKADRIFDYLDSVFSADIDRMREYSDVEWNEELREEASQMFSASAYVEARGEARGITMGERNAEARFTRLVGALAAAGKLERIKEISGSENALRQMYKEYGITD